MKFAIAALLFTSFFSIAVFGVLAMNHESSHGYSGCIAATLQGSGCPDQANALEFLSFHLAAFRSFSIATLSENILGAFLLLAALALFIGLGAAAAIGVVQSPLAAYSQYRHFRGSFPWPSQRELTRWLALREHSPASL